jgi:hypothetical protein
MFSRKERHCHIAIHFSGVLILLANDTRVLDCSAALAEVMTFGTESTCTLSDDRRSLQAEFNDSKPTNHH